MHMYKTSCIKKISKVLTLQAFCFSKKNILRFWKRPFHKIIKRNSQKSLCQFKSHMYHTHYNTRVSPLKGKVRSWQDTRPFIHQKYFKSWTLKHRFRALIFLTLCTTKASACQMHDADAEHLFLFVLDNV